MTCLLVGGLGVTGYLWANDGEPAAAVPWGHASAGFGRHGGGRIGERLEKLADALELTDGQRAQIREIVQSHRTELRDRFRAVAVAHAAVTREVLAEELDRNALHEAAAAHSAPVEAAAAEVAEVLAEVRAVLTPEQRERLREHRESWAERRQARLDTMRDVMDTIQK
jgi:Spy/CpxP family protein refolding chaperone